MQGSSSSSSFQSRDCHIKMLLVSSNCAVRHGGESALHHFSQSMCWEVEGHRDSSITRSRRSSREDRVDAPVCCVTQQGQGSCVEVKGMTAKQPVKAALEFLNNLSNLMEQRAIRVCRTENYWLFFERLCLMSFTCGEKYDGLLDQVFI